MRILALTRYERLGSSSRVRFYQYHPYLESQGVVVDSAPFFKDEYVRNLYTAKPTSFLQVLRAYLERVSRLADSGAYELLWVEKELFPWLPAWLERLLSSRKIPYVVDYDDAVFHRYDLHPSSLVRALLGGKIDRVMRQAALVIAGNEYLADRAKEAGAQRVEILPSVVDVHLYQTPEEITGSPFQVGWVGSPVTAPYLDLVREPLMSLSHELDLQLVLIGPGKVAPFGEIPTTVLPWSEEMETSIGMLFDVGIMPLVDGPFERGKCGYKLVQYMAGGLPVVASPVGVNRQIVSPGENGFLAASAPEWLDALRKLGRDAGLRRKMGQSGRHQAEQMYNLQVTAPKLLALLTSIRR